MRLYDSHCHLHDDRVRGEADALMARAKAAGVDALLLAGVDPAGWLHEVELAARFPSLRMSFGVHPQVVADVGEAAHAMVDTLERGLAGELPRPAAIGEIGLDGLEARAASLDLQDQIFRRQLELARRYDLPVALHVLRAHPRALAVLESEPALPRGGVLHSCSASADLVKRWVDLGFYISFAGSVVDDKARRIRAAALATPLERLMVETDAPDQTPLSRRPARNEPAFLPDVVAALATLHGRSLEAIAEITSDNARRLFG
jgi:TatD DNase family protein